MSIKEPSIFGRWIGLQVNPNNKKQLYVILDRDVPMSKEIIQEFNELFGGINVALNIKEMRERENNGII